MKQGDYKKEKEGKRKMMSFIGELALYVILFLICVIVIPRYVVGRYTVDGQSMQNTLFTDQQLLGEKVSYHFSKPDRFDIVVVRPYENQEDNYYVKRIIGLPGETIEVIDDAVFIDGKKISDPYKKETMRTQDIGPVTLKENEYFVMGDNRNNSEDSRKVAIGPIPQKRIVAHIVLRVWPWKKIRTFS